MGFMAAGGVLAGGDASAEFFMNPDCAGCPCGLLAGDSLRLTVAVTFDDGSCTSFDGDFAESTYNGGATTPFGTGEWEWTINHFPLALSFALACDDSGGLHLDPTANCDPAPCDAGWRAADSVSCDPLSAVFSGIVFACCTGCTFTITISPGP